MNESCVRGNFHKRRFRSQISPVYAGADNFDPLVEKVALHVDPAFEPITRMGTEAVAERVGPEALCHRRIYFPARR